MIAGPPVLYVDTVSVLASELLLFHSPLLVPRACSAAASRADQAARVHAAMPGKTAHVLFRWVIQPRRVRGIDMSTPDATPASRKLPLAAPLS